MAAGAPAAGPEPVRPLQTAFPAAFYQALREASRHGVWPLGHGRYAGPSSTPEALRLLGKAPGQEIQELSLYSLENGFAFRYLHHGASMQNVPFQPIAGEHLPDLVREFALGFTGIPKGPGSFPAPPDHDRPVPGCGQSTFALRPKGPPPPIPGAVIKAARNAHRHGFHTGRRRMINRAKNSFPGSPQLLLEHQKDVRARDLEILGTRDFGFAVACGIHPLTGNFPEDSLPLLVEETLESEGRVPEARFRELAGLPAGEPHADP